jgi:hypothetical protein
MAPEREMTAWKGKLAKGCAISGILAFGIPLALSVAFDSPIFTTLSLVVATLAIEYGAVPVGLAFGLHPLFVLAVTSSIALAVITLLFTILDTLGERSGRVARMIHRTRTKYQHSRLVQRYGIFSLLPAVLIVGFYVCPPIAWILGWDRARSIVLLMLGFTAISTVLLAAGLGLIGSL